VRVLSHRVARGGKRADSTTAKSRGGRFVVTRPDQPPLASAKAPADVRAVCISHGLAPIDLHDFDRSTAVHRFWGSVRSAVQLCGAAARLASAGDVVVQYPLGRLNELVLHQLKLGSRSVCVVHDLEVLRRPETAQREGSTLGRFDVVIAHSEAMADVVRAMQPDVSLVALEAFDFLGTGAALPAAARPSCLYVFGNLIRDKTGYLYGLGDRQDGPTIEAYGPNCEVDLLPRGIRWHGVLDPDRPDLGEIRGFGLVWDGDSSTSLEGPVGTYLRYNAPHKFSLYLALGIPVIVPVGAAIAPVVDRYGLGVCVASVEEGLSFVENCTQLTWNRMLESVRDVQRRVLAGEFVSSALLRAGVADERLEPSGVRHD
jgi:hypothetical protein